MLTTEIEKEPRFTNDEARRIIAVTKTVYPCVLLIVFLVAFISRTIYKTYRDPTTAEESCLTGPGGRPLPQRRKSAKRIVKTNDRPDFSPNAKFTINWLMVIVLVTFVANAFAIIAQTVLYRHENWWCGQSAVIYITASFFVWAVVLISLVDTTPSPTISHLLSWIVTLPLEIIIIGASLTLYSHSHHEPKVGDPAGGRLQPGITPWELFEVICYFIRFVVLLTLIMIFAAIKISRSARSSFMKPLHADENTSLLGQTRQNGTVTANGYGTRKPHHQVDEHGQDPWAKPKEVPTVNWFQYLRGYKVFFPYLWPAKSWKLQLIAMLCFTLVVIQRVINVLVPVQVGNITIALAGEDDKGVRVPWLTITFYVFLRWIQGPQGLLSALRNYLWLPVSQYAYRELSTAAFQHVHGLSLDFHLGKKTGEVISALNKGNAINTFLEQVTFSLGPMVFDLIVAVVYLGIKFDVYLSLVVAVVTFFYIYITIRIAQWRQEVRRQMVDADRMEDAVKNDSLVSYETVKYFNAERYEFQRYRGAVKAFQVAEKRVIASLNVMNVAQNSCFMLALLVSCFIEAFQVATNEKTVGDFVTLLTYLAQLQAPLNFFGTFYRSIQTSLINAERMLELFKEQPTVVDGPDVRPLRSCKGSIAFDHVDFSYDPRKTALTDVNFRCAPGTTTALVGESGGGKSTVFRLLFRFYNPTQGLITVDDNDVQSLSIDSVRQHVGVVPQDTVLFNETLMYNIRYAKQDATDEEVYAACRAASIHDKILSFPDGYETKVGERGLRLSGGEKQRVAIARTILKNPKIILLDEATAALDTETEEHIQEAFRTLGEGRTMIVIAHRLSTITSADQILVFSGGRIIESGDHETLVEMNGKYASMWRKQIRAQKAAVEAEELRKRARDIMEAGGADSTSQSEDEGKVQK
ncbi:putative heavy metal tolerance protein [Phaeomoniella chlamydospora]|uniref:Putative heavy metal tolerance protein n=1 Tax=Phaeomoniella chlamydospora TaxID=158046 RepID=A0A0G2DTW3_PHACM|nr:putative heavy metal tolerance protein [Phaeomoniella chlamydospora]